MTLDLHFRATSKRALVRLGHALDFILPNDPENPGIHSAVGVDIDIIAKGAMVHKPAVYDNDGFVTTPAVVDNDHIHANVRLTHVALLLDKLTGTDEDGFDKSKIRRWCKANGVTINVDSVRRPGEKTHHWFSKDFGGGDVVELIWPAPEQPRRVWL